MMRDLPAARSRSLPGRPHRFVGLIVALAALVGPALAPSPAAAAEPVNRIVLQVNDRIATLRDYEERLGPRLAAINRQEIDPDERQRLRARLPTEVMRDLFEEMLLLSRADQLNIRVSDPEIDALVAQVRQANNLESDEELQRAVAQTGQTWEGFRNELAKTQRSQEVVGREVYSRISLEEDEMRIYYRDNPDLFRTPARRQLKEIVVLEDSGLDAEAMESIAEGIVQRLGSGEDLESIASGYEDRGITSGVIDLDWVPVGDLDPDLEAAIENLGPGEASRPVVARGGLHIVQVQDIEEARIQPFDEVEDQIFVRERSRLFQREFPKYLEELADQSHVRADPPPGSEGFREAGAVEEEDPLEAFRTPRAADAPDPAPPPTAAAAEEEEEEGVVDESGGGDGTGSGGQG